MKKRSYMDGTFLYGRIATIICMAIMLGIPAIISIVYDAWPTAAKVFTTAGPLLALFIPTVLAEVVAYTPIQGTAAYIMSIMGNVGNIKLPCALNALEATDSIPSTEQGDVICMCAACVSGMVTTVIVALGVVLMVPLQPLLTTEAFSTATSYVLPALYGSMAVSIFLSKNAGSYVVDEKFGKMKIALVPLAVVCLLRILFPVVASYQGYVLVGMILVTIATCYLFYNKGIVKVADKQGNRQ